MPLIEVAGNGLDPDPKLWRKWQRVLGEDEVKVFLYLHSLVPEGGGVYEEDPRMLAQGCGMSQMRFRNAVERLTKLGLISRDDGD